MMRRKSAGNGWLGPGMEITGNVRMTGVDFEVGKFGVVCRSGMPGQRAPASKVSPLPTVPRPGAPFPKAFDAYLTAH